ncbi:hypothetical protein AeRB84_015842 [Aphanomyces euteiches]|nr:hypothetical protein AeRB84_015842 [Aphanomyces euteiches]
MAHSGWKSQGLAPQFGRFIPPSMDLHTLESTFRKLDQKMEKILDDQDAKFRKLEAALDNGRHRIGVLEKQVECLADVTVKALKEHVLPHAINVVRRPSSFTDSLLTTTSTVLFVWKDGTTRRAPEAWTFPTTDCRKLWQLWFHGDDIARIGPFRLLAKCDLKDFESKRQLSVARVVVRVFVNLAVSTALVTSEAALIDLPLDTSLELFDQVLNQLLHNDPSGPHQDNSEESGGLLQVSNVLSLPYSRIYDAFPDEVKKQYHSEESTPSFEWRDGSKHCVPEDWTFPTEACKEMWLRWHLGEPSLGIVPFRRLRESHLKLKACQNQLAMNTVVFKKLSEIAVEHSFAESFEDLEEMLPSDLSVVFDNAISLLLPNSDKEARRRANLQTSSIAAVFKAMTQPVDVVKHPGPIKRKTPAASSQFTEPVKKLSSRPSAYQETSLLPPSARSVGRLAGRDT